MAKTRDSCKSVEASPVWRNEGVKRHGSRWWSPGPRAQVLGDSRVHMAFFPQVQLSESKRELTELRSALHVLQKEKEQLQEEKQVRRHNSGPLGARVEDLKARNFVSSYHLLA